MQLKVEAAHFTALIHVAPHITAIHRTATYRHGGLLRIWSWFSSEDGREPSRIWGCLQKGFACDDDPGFTLRILVGFVIRVIGFKFFVNMRKQMI